MFIGETAYTGFKYLSNSNEEQWDKTPIAGNNISSSFACSLLLPSQNRTRFKVEGTTLTGRKVKIEDKGDGKGPQVYEDKNNDGDYDDDTYDL